MKKNIIFVIIIIILLGIIGFGGYQYMKLQKDNDKLTKDNKTITEELNRQKEEIENLKKQDETLNNDTNEDNTTIKDTYVFDTSSSYKGYGTVVVTGYASVEKNSGYDGSTYDYVFFNITHCDNNDFMKFLKNSSDTAGVKNDAIGIGSVNNKTIERTSFSNQYGGKTEKLSKMDSNRILNTSATNVIKLKLEILKDLGRRDVSESYSPINNITIIG